MCSTRIKYLTNVFFDSKIYTMKPETLKFLHDAICNHTICVAHDETGSEYSLELESGSMLTFSCEYKFDEMNRPGRYYCVSIDYDILIDGFCLDEKKPTKVTRQIINLIKRCSNKIVTQEIQSRRNGILNQIGSTKVYS